MSLLSFKPNATLGSPGHFCQSSTPPDNLRYWWCYGSQYRLQIGEVVDAQSGVFDHDLDSEIRRRVGKTVLVPVCADHGEQCDIRGFPAVKIVRKTSYGIEVTYVDYFMWPGAIVDRGNGMDTRAYVINLVR